MSPGKMSPSQVTSRRRGRERCRGAAAEGRVDNEAWMLRASGKVPYRGLRSSGEKAAAARTAAADSRKRVACDGACAGAVHASDGDGGRAARRIA